MQTIEDQTADGQTNGSVQRRSNLTEEQIHNIIDFLDVVQDVVDRLRSEGYVIKDGNIFPPK
jgi:hypothetical protein